MPELEKRLESLMIKVSAKSDNESSCPKSAKQIQAVQFSLFIGDLTIGDQSSVISNPMARCALFAPVKERTHFKEYTLVGEVDGFRIEMKGEQFNQDDHDFLLQMVKMALHKPFGVDVYQSVNAVLGGLNRHTREAQRKQLFSQIERLVSGTLRITPKGGASYQGHLVDDATTPQDQKTEPRHRRTLAYRLNPKFEALYKKNSFTVIDFYQRLNLKGRGSELAKWLQLFIESHAEQYQHKVETLRDRSGSATKNLKHFRTMLRQALDLLKGAGIILDWKIDPKSDLVTIERTPSESQQKHITKKASRKPRK